jgi:hypothetical protein
MGALYQRTGKTKPDTTVFGQETLIIFAAYLQEGPCVG